MCRKTLWIPGSCADSGRNGEAGLFSVPVGFLYLGVGCGAPPRRRSCRFTHNQAEILEILRHISLFFVSNLIYSVQSIYNKINKSAMLYFNDFGPLQSL